MKLCICCLYRFPIDLLNFYKVKPGLQLAGKYLALCDNCQDEKLPAFIESFIGPAIRGAKNAA
jgi:hypothetical protein